MELSTPARIFKFNGEALADLNPSASAEDVMRMHAATIPELATAVVEGPVFNNGEQIYTFNTRLGTKG